MSLLNRIEKHMSTCAIAAIGAAAVGAIANGAIVYTSFNHVIPNNIDGTYLNVETGAFVDGAGSGVPGWDVNPYGSSTSAISFFSSTGGGYVTLSSGVSNLAAGTVISAASTYVTGAISNTSAGAGIWGGPNTTNIVGFKFVDSTSATRYGWMRIAIGANYGTRTLVDYAWENSGSSIQAGAVPGPAGLAALALGAVGIRSRRRK